MRLLRALPDRYQRLARELLSFGVAGVVNTAFGFLLFNLLFSSMGSLWANAVSTAGGTATSFILNRYITYRHRPRRALRQELPLFGAVNLVGLGIQQGVMAMSKVAFNLQSTDRLEYNLVRVVSVAIGTIFLLLCYRYLVFRKARPGVAEDLAIEIGVPLPPAAPAPDAARGLAATGPVAPANGGAVHGSARNGSTPFTVAPINGANANGRTGNGVSANGTAVNGTAVNGASLNGAAANGGGPLGGPAVNGAARHSAEATAAARHSAEAAAASNGGRPRTVSPDTFHELTTPLEIGRPAQAELSPELELEELLPIESAPDASGHIRP